MIKQKLCPWGVWTFYRFQQLALRKKKPQNLHVFHKICYLRNSMHVRHFTTELVSDSNSILFRLWGVARNIQKIINWPKIFPPQHSVWEGTRKKRLKINAIKRLSQFHNIHIFKNILTLYHEWCYSAIPVTKISDWFVGQKFRNPMYLRKH